MLLWLLNTWLWSNSCTELALPLWMGQRPSFVRSSSATARRQRIQFASTGMQCRPLPTKLATAYRLFSCTGQQEAREGLSLFIATGCSAAAGGIFSSPITACNCTVAATVRKFLTSALQRHDSSLQQTGFAQQWRRLYRGVVYLQMRCSRQGCRPAQLRMILERS